MSKTPFIVREQILERAGFLVRCRYTLSGKRRWNRHEEFLEKLDALIQEYWEEFKRNPEEEEEYQRHIVSW